MLCRERGERARDPDGEWETKESQKTSNYLFQLSAGGAAAEVSEDAVLGAARAGRVGGVSRPDANTGGRALDTACMFLFTSFKKKTKEKKNKKEKPRNESKTVKEGVSHCGFFLNILCRCLFSFSGQNLVPEPPFQVQEAVEKWRNPPGAARGFERVASLHVSANDRLGLSTFHSEDEQREPHFTSEQQPAAHQQRAVVVLGQLLLVLVHELCDASAAAGAAQLGHQRWNDILKHTNRNSLGWEQQQQKKIGRYW